MTVQSKLRVGPSRKGARPLPKPHLPGKHCPNCGEERERPVKGDMAYPGWETWVDSPHENPFDCIRFLRRELESLRDDLKSFRHEYDRSPG